MSGALINLFYLIAAVLFILGLKGLTHPRTAVRGNLMGALGMLIAIVVTLTDHRIVSFQIIVAGFVVGGLIGAAMAYRAPHDRDAPGGRRVQRIRGRRLGSGGRGRLHGGAERGVDRRDQHPVHHRGGYVRTDRWCCLDGQCHRVRQAAGAGAGASRPDRRPSRDQHLFAGALARTERLVDSGARLLASVLGPGGCGLPARSHAGHSDWRRRHAGRDLTAQRLFGARRRRPRLGAQQQRAHRRWLTRGSRRFSSSRY